MSDVPPDSPYGAPPDPDAPPYGAPAPWSQQAYPATGYPTDRPGTGVVPGVPGRLARWWQRALARVFDGVLIAAAGAAVAVPLLLPQIRLYSRELAALPSGATPPPLSSAFGNRILVATVLFALGGYLYEWLFIAVRGATLGKMALGIRVVQVDGSVPGWARSLRRMAVPLAGAVIQFTAIGALGGLAGLAVFVVYVSFLWDPRRQSYNDKLAGTFVVVKPGRMA
ncbi:MAG TPA: RDD family protein [Mycobacteriales bacterium]|nr:RDD family protein [Mycobacteriales bacterium]